MVSTSDTLPRGGPPPPPVMKMSMEAFEVKKKQEAEVKRKEAAKRAEPKDTPAAAATGVAATGAAVSRRAASKPAAGCLDLTMIAAKEEETRIRLEAANRAVASCASTNRDGCWL